MASVTPAVLHTTYFLSNDSKWGSTYTTWPAQGQMSAGANLHPSVLEANFTADAAKWTSNGVAFAEEK